MIEGEQAANANIVFSKLELLLLLEFVGIGIVSSEADKGGRKKYYSALAWIGGWETVLFLWGDDFLKEAAYLGLKRRRGCDNNGGC